MKQKFPFSYAGVINKVPVITQGKAESLLGFLKVLKKNFKVDTGSSTTILFKFERKNPRVGKLKISAAAWRRTGERRERRHSI